MPTGESALITELHDGVFEQPLWGRFLESLRVQTQASYANLIFRPSENGPMVQLYAGTPLAEHLQQIFRERFGIDPLPHYQMREGRIYTMEELTDPRNAVQQAFIRDVLAPGGMQFMRSVRVTESSGVDAWLAVLDGKDFNASTSALLSRTVPHMRIALRAFVALEKGRIRSSIASEAFGRLNFGWLTLDPQCRIVDMTPNINAILQHTGLMRRGRYGRLTFASTIVEREVAHVVKSITTGMMGATRVFNISRDPWTTICVASVPLRLLSPGSPATAILYVSGDHWSRSDRCDQLVELFGLLPSEARLAWTLAQGNSIQQSAELLGITVETARNYSKKVYSKTGTSRQAELVRIILSSVLAIV